MYFRHYTREWTGRRAASSSAKRPFVSARLGSGASSARRMWTTVSSRRARIMARAWTVSTRLRVGVARATRAGFARRRGRAASAARRAPSTVGERRTSVFAWRLTKVSELETFVGFGPLKFLCYLLVLFINNLTYIDLISTQLLKCIT